MKLLLTILLIVPAFTYSQDRSFDVSLQESMGMRKSSDGHIKIEAGISGRKIPVSLLAGVHYLEFDNDGAKIGIGNRMSNWGYNATVMIRISPLDTYWMNRTIDFNLYASSYYSKGVLPFYECGIKTGIMINTRSRIYVYGGNFINSKYNSPIAGVTFDLLFFNGYSAY